MSYSPHNIRNICLLGHGGNGKTTLVESFLRMTGVIDRLGKTTDGNTVCDYDPEEIKRQISISAAVAPVEYNGCKINVLDAPGNFDFAGEVAECLSVADAGDVLGDLNKRRGRVMDMQPIGGGQQTITAEAPMAEMMTYAIDLRAMTQSRGSYVQRFVRYEECPGPAQEKAIAAAKAMAEE